MRFVVEKAIKERVEYLRIIAEDAKSIRKYHENVRIFKVGDGVTFDQTIRAIVKKKGNQ